jgi:hypothetical protein
LFSDKERWREIFPVSLLASMLGCLTDMIMQYYPLWQYQDGNPMFIHSVNDFGVFLVVTYLFIQWLPKRQTFWRMAAYWFIWTGAVISLEFFYNRTGRLVYHQWWNIWCSYLADWFLFALFYSYHRLFRFEKLS